ncbi:hydantoinase B/oxoprolinase family protein [Chloroflexota bacterium]
MGICYQGKTLKQVVEDRTRLFSETGHAYGLKKLELVESDPAKFMRFQMRLVSACINARESAKLISANPMSMVQGELLFMLAGPEGDAVSASYGLAGHVQCFPFITRNIAELGFEDDPCINPGDIFACNDAMYGTPHNADNYTWLPVFYKGELISWTVGLNHIVDVGGIQPGGLGTISTSVFTDGFTYPPTKTGENFKQHKWWELHWKRRTRTELFNVLDDKMRAAGIVSLHDRVLEIVEEFGVDYYRKGLREIIERERRVLVNRIKTQAIPGIYHSLQLSAVKYKGTLGRLWPASNRNWILHKPGELHVRPNGTLFTDTEGLTSEGEFHCNAYEPAVRVISSLGMWPMFAYTETINSSLMYMTDWNLPPGSMFNPQNPWAATVMGLGEVNAYIYMFHNCLSYAYFARGFLEETFPADGTAIGYGMAGKLADGFQWAGGDMALITCWSEGATPYHDGFPASVCSPNPAADMGEAEVTEFLLPTQVNIGRKLIPDYCGHGKFRGGLGLGMLQMVNQPGMALIVAAFAATNGMGGCAFGRCGGYPTANDIIVFAHDTNIRELLEQGHSYPRDFSEMMEWIDEGILKAGSIEAYKGPTPSIPCKDGDLYATASGSRGGWGDVLEREYGLVEEDLEYGWISSDVAKGVYGVITNENGKVNVEESDRMRQSLRDRRKERSVDAKEWWKQEREVVLNKDWHEDIYNMFADNCKWDKFNREFVGMWQLSADYSLS